MKKCLLAVLVVAGLSVNAETEVFRLLRDTETDATAVVGVDNVPRTAHLMSEQEWHFVTNMVFKWCAYMNSSKEGRKALHGEKVGGVVVTTNDVGIICKRQEYADGYVHEETGEVAPSSRRVSARQGFPKELKDAKPRKIPAPKKPQGISERQYQMRMKRERALKKIPVEVTIEHNANTGKDTVR